MSKELNNILKNNPPSIKKIAEKYTSANQKANIPTNFYNSNIKKTYKNSENINKSLRAQALYKSEAIELQKQQTKMMQVIREFVKAHPEYKKVDYMEGNIHIIYEGPSKCITDKGQFVQKTLLYKYKNATSQPTQQSGIKIIK